MQHDTSKIKKDLKRFVKRMSGFLLFALLCVVVMFLLPIDKKFNYSFTYNNCMGQGTWIFNRIYENESNIDIAFIGSSHTICGVNDSLLEYEMRSPFKSIQVANIAYCRLGRNLHYTFAKQLLEHKRTKCIVLEVDEEENLVGHPEFGYFAESADVLSPVLVVNKGFFKDVFDALFVRLFRYREKIISTHEQYIAWDKKYGYMDATQKADSNVLIEYKNRRKTREGHDWVRSINNKYPFKYLDKIAQMSNEKGCDLYFLYIPSYGASKQPLESSKYSELGTLLIPPANILDDVNNWKDPDHMNDYGAEKISKWLAKELVI